MTAPVAIRQFIAIYGGEPVAKGAFYEEPLRGDPPAIARLMGQCDYIASLLRSPLGDITCPFVPDTADAALWAYGKRRERRDERAVVEAYARRSAKS